MKCVIKNHKTVTKRVTVCKGTFQIHFGTIRSIIMGTPRDV